MAMSHMQHLVTGMSCVISGMSGVTSATSYGARQFDIGGGQQGSGQACWSAYIFSHFFLSNSSKFEMKHFIDPKRSEILSVFPTSLQ
jgi:hypothetical protein